jgi:hypothetical protein
MASDSPDEDGRSMELDGFEDGQGLFPKPGDAAPSDFDVVTNAPGREPAGSLTRLHLIENPIQATPANTDCVSCHTSSRLIRSRKVPFAGSAGEYPNPAGVTGFAEAALQQDTPESVRNFGWRFTRPVVTTLTANSSAAVADLVNQSQGWANPSPLDCGRPEVRACFAGRGSDGKAATCLKLCTQRTP